MIQLVQGNIINQEVDAIVNAANQPLYVGHGVDGAIHDAAGPSVHMETAANYPDGCPTGSAVPTAAGNLPVKHIFHAVGPVWYGGDGGEREKLHSAFTKCMELAVEHECKSIAFPAISTGVYGYPMKEGAEVAIEAVMHFLKSHKMLGGDDILVRFVLWDKPSYDVWDEVLHEVLKRDADDNQ